MLKTIEHEDCDGNETFIRAGGDCVCTVCSKFYWQHPYCTNSLFEISPSGRPQYYLHVLCDGTHVKL